MSTHANPDLSNWGRWGSQDQQGCLNLITPALIRQAASLVKTGKAYSLSAPLAENGPNYGGFHQPWKVTTTDHPTARVGTCMDTLIIQTHNGTHIDPLCHVWYDDVLYNGFNARQHIQSSGASRCSMAQIPFIIGRGILLDVARWKGVDHLQGGGKNHSCRFGSVRRSQPDPGAVGRLAFGPHGLDESLFRRSQLIRQRRTWPGYNHSSLVKRSRYRPGRDR